MSAQNVIVIPARCGPAGTAARRPACCRWAGRHARTPPARRDRASCWLEPRPARRPARQAGWPVRAPGPRRGPRGSRSGVIIAAGLLVAEAAAIALSRSCLTRTSENSRLTSRSGRMAALIRGEQGRAVRCGLAHGLLLGCLVPVELVEQVLLDEPLGVQVLDLEVGELRSQSFPQVVLCALGDPAQVAEGPPTWPAILGNSLGPKMTSAITVRTSSLGRERSNTAQSFPRPPDCSGETYCRPGPRTGRAGGRGGGR